MLRLQAPSRKALRCAMPRYPDYMEYSHWCNTSQEFRFPGYSKGDDVGLFDSFRVVLCTLSASIALFRSQVPRKTFTHVFVDEAAQACLPEVRIRLYGKCA